MTPRPLRIAVEGCGHGTLDAIYDAVIESCELKGWDTVDLLIIGGDFQAVRNHADLNVTAMPQKYRQLGDFHKYYSGEKKAPFLTIFIGGNHEASNYLFELYYGGWAAPNIYYMGATNVLNFSGQRIAALSGIWKGYDYNKPHFERLPYNNSDIHSIFHVRELDVRKLLAVRTQVNIGLSHDWPREIEKSGDSRWLFNKKKGFAEDAANGKLGSVAARQCLDRLRPQFWFSAHLHTRFTAVMQHNPNDQVQNSGLENVKYGYISCQNATPKNAEVFAENQTEKAVQVNATESIETQPRYLVPADVAQVSAWKSFSSQVKNQDVEREHLAAVLRQAEDNAYVTPSFVETFKKIVPTANAGRERVHHEEENRETNGQSTIPNTDGARDESLLKRKRLASSPIQAATVSKATNVNLDEIDVDSSDSDTPERIDSKVTNKSVVIPDVKPSPAKDNNASNDNNRREDHSKEVKDDKTSFNVDAESFIPGRLEADHNVTKSDVKSTTEDVSEDLRAQLAQMSSNFVPTANIGTSAPLPVPKEITNRETKFLALGKVAWGQKFLQLVEIPGASVEISTDAPLKLQYDPEWLAITRVFAQELALGGDPKDTKPPHCGDTHYQSRIEEELPWVQSNIVDKGLLTIPDNFALTAPTSMDARDHPREYTNPQTTAFCNLLGLVNPFDISEQEREERVANGPRPEEPQHNNRHRSDGHSRGGFRGNRGGFGHGRGRGRGRW